MANQSSARRCFVCDSEENRFRSDVDARIHTRFEGSKVVQCTRCGFGWLTPMPSDAEIAAAYGENYLADYENVEQLAVVNESDAASQLSDRLAWLADKYPSRGNILDVGASRGIFLNLARQHGWTPFGLDFDLDAIAFARLKFDLEIVRGPIEPSTFDEESFEVVHASHVLEHVRDLENALNAFRKWLKNDGSLVIEVPYEYGGLVDGFARVALGRELSENQVESSHLHFFTPGSLAKLLERFGFQTIAVQSFRRNAIRDSQYPAGGLIKGLLYHLENVIGRGPLIEVYAMKSE